MNWYLTIKTARIQVPPKILDSMTKKVVEYVRSRKISLSITKIKKELAELRIDKRHLKDKYDIDYDANGVPFNVPYTKEEKAVRQGKLEVLEKRIQQLVDDENRLSAIPRHGMPMANEPIEIKFNFSEDDWRYLNILKKNNFNAIKYGQLTLVIFNKTNPKHEGAHYVSNKIAIYLGAFDNVKSKEEEIKALLEHELIHWVQDLLKKKNFGMPGKRIKTPQHDYLKEDTEENYFLTDYEFWPNLKDCINEFRNRFPDKDPSLKQNRRNFLDNLYIRHNVFLQSLKKYPKKYQFALKELYKGISDLI